MTRPGPDTTQASSKALHPIYAALDSRNYNKALKLSSGGDCASWDIVKALRAHALERSGRRRDALLLLWDLLGGDGAAASSDGGAAGRGSSAWRELADRIDALTDAADLLESCTSSSGLLDAVQRLDRACFAVHANAAGLVVAVEVSSGANQSKSAHRPSRGKKFKDCAESSNSKAAKQVAALPPITDETVLQTIAVTLKVEGLYDTMSEMYHQAVMEGNDSNLMESSSIEQQKEFGNVLEEAVCVHFKALCDCDAFICGGVGKDACNADSSGSSRTKKSCTLQELQTQQRQTKYYERMQSTALQLAKYTGEPLHFQWTAVSSLWYRRSLEGLAMLMQHFYDELNDVKIAWSIEEKDRMQGWLIKILDIATVDEIPSKCITLRQKMALLPRLAESLSYRMIQNKLQDTGAAASTEGRRQYYAPSDTDWDVYIETLTVQNKLEEALEALRGVNCSPLEMNGVDSNRSDENIPQIHDEDTIDNHVGTILPYTQRKKLEQMSRIALQLGMAKEAEGWYQELLGVFPDQWTYWMGLVDSCVLVGGGGFDDEGWGRCHDFVEEIVVNNDTLRGPHLFFVELAALKLKHLTDNDKGGKAELIALLQKAICNYGDKFSSVASCCFADLRPYLELLVQSCTDESDVDAQEGVALVMKWAKGLWKVHSQSSSGQSAAGRDISLDEISERRKKLRTYIFAVQVCYCLAAESGKAKPCNSSQVSTVTMELLRSHTPSMDAMISEWRISLAFLPGVPPKDGGQKETLPGDEIALMISQYMQLQASCETSQTKSDQQLIAAAGLLEEAIEHSPYNASLKIAAVGLYSRLKAAHRAYKHYQDMGVKYIQIESCSYLILPILIQGGLYTQAAQLSSSLVRFHGSTSKDVKEYSTKSFKKGYLLKAKEMVSFQTQKMRRSVQLLQAKGFVMDCAALLNASDLFDAKRKGEVRLGSEQGLCGREDDVARAERLVNDAEGYFNVPSILHSASNTASARDLISSDNRDLTVNYFEILHLSDHSSGTDIGKEALFRGHTQGILIRAVMATDAAKAPKKGKVPKNTAAMLLRCKSLLIALKKAKQFVNSGGADMSGLDKSFWEATCSLCDVITGVIQGDGDADPKDTLADREKIAASAISLAVSSLSEVRAALPTIAGDTICKLLPARIVPLFTLTETTGRLFALFGWGKRKRATKEAAGALANLALSFKDILSDMLQTMKHYRVFESSASVDASLDIGTDYIHKAIGHVISSRDMTIDRVDPFLLQMMEALETYASEEP